MPRWAVASAAFGPLLLIGGWTVAQLLQPASYHPLHDTISALAGLGAHERWVMTIGLGGLGVCHGITAAGLRPAAPAGRAALAAGGAATLAVAALPLPRVGTSTAHGTAAAMGFVALAVWPVLACRPRTALVPSPVPTVLRPRVAWPAAALLLGLLGAFALQLVGRGPWIGLTERLVAGAEALWPLVTVVIIRRLPRAPAPPCSGR